MSKLGKIYVVGLGPGESAHMTPAAANAIIKSQVIVGYKTYINLIEDLLENKEVVSSGMRKEIDRCEKALQLAEEGKVVSLVSSGDAGVYGMAGIMHEIVAQKETGVEVEVIPGVTAANAAAASLGAPLMHDYTVISLSDLLTPWSLIEKRLECAGEGDFVVCLYNPKSMGRQKQIEITRDILLKYKKGNTPVGIVRNAKRQGETIAITNLDNMLNEDIDMVTMVIIGNSNTKVENGFMITPRGYNL